MAHVALKDENSHGIVSLLQTFPDTARCLVSLAEHMLRRETPGLSMAEREIIAGYVSRLGQCEYCDLSHSRVGEAMLGRPGLVEAAVCDPDSPDLRPVLKALLPIAAKVQRDPKSVSAADVARARTAGASDQEIHDTVLIAAAFCMFNRYVDGLDTSRPADPSEYDEGVERTIERGYVEVLEELLSGETNPESK
ncbi:MAG: peroxidase-related enzyme [Gammaproteobacteria bacterium]|nr:peroxidase-related enzyme [Gammaproteobacteria bacterium]